MFDSEGNIVACFQLESKYRLLRPTNQQEQQVSQTTKGVKKHIGFNFIDEQVMNLLSSIVSIKFDQIKAIRMKHSMQTEVLNTIELAGKICSQRNSNDLVKNMKEVLPKYFGFEAAGVLLRDVKTDFIFTMYEYSRDET